MTHRILRLENKKEDEDSEDLPAARKKELPIIFTRAMEKKPISIYQIPPNFLAWDALITTLSQFDIAERVAYSYSVSLHLSSIIADLFVKVSELKQGVWLCTLIIA